MLDATPSRRRAGVLLAIAAIGLATILLIPEDALGAPYAAALAVVFVLCALAIGRFDSAWPARRWLVVAQAAAAGVLAIHALIDTIGDEPRMASILDAIFLAALAPYALALADEFRAHVGAADRREIALDSALTIAALGAIGYVVIAPAGGADASAAVFALVSAGLATGALSLGMWIPSRDHRALALASLPLAVGTLAFGNEWVTRSFDGFDLWTALAIAATPVAQAAVVLRAAHDERPGSGSRLVRPAAAAVSIAAATAAMVTVAVANETGHMAGDDGTFVLILLGVGLMVRVLANQRSSADDHEQVREALQHREEALAEADRALDRVREANEVLRRSEEHLRLVFEAAVDGFVEIEADGTIARANDAFCTMVRLDRGRVEGIAWESLAEDLDGADDAFAHLSDGGAATIARTDGPPTHLEARVSEVPTDPPRRLLLIRDVTAAKVADQTIRSLFQFLQDRDEDRTRLLRRTNAAIENERNRVARDLHDGPVQGVSAASLSLEAALLMIRSGDVENGLSLLARIREELAGEADALRRLMADLRPPVLEERGLMPALRDTLARFGTETGVTIEFGGRLARSIPDDLETLAFRVVQEALQNVARHAGATHVSVTVETDSVQLRIEVEDDGRGFDTAEVREFLRAGRVGLAAMRERVELASGTFAVRSNPGRGTAVMATVPLDTALVVAAT
jgi:PAS domain S-box-containing protein